MTRKQKRSIKRTKKYIKYCLCKETFLRVSEEPNSVFSFMSQSEQQKKLGYAIQILKNLKTVPQFLFKYRSCNENNFKALEENSVWVSSAEQFIDHYDCRIPLSIKDLPTKRINKLMKWFVFTEFIYGYKKENLSRFEDALTPAEVRKIFFSKCYDDELFFNGDQAKKFIKKKYPKEQWDAVANKIVFFDEAISRRGRGQKLRDWFKEDCEIGCLSTIDLNRKAKFICSLTETYSNPKMWEEYADNYTGFCIGYDFSQIITTDLLNNMSTVYALTGLLPVFYTKRRPKFDSYEFQLLQYKDTFYETEDEYWSPFIEAKLYLQMLVKDPRYLNEQEWRIVICGDEPGLVWFPFATAIYMGKNISEGNRAKLIKIAIQNNLIIYQQKTGVDKFQYDVVDIAKDR